jgi:CheY-like chemotaxis protein
MARILVIDDDDTVRLSLKLALEDADHHVEDAADGEEGDRPCFGRTRPTWWLPIFYARERGHGTIDEIKRDRPETKIIAISGGGRMDPDDYLNIARRVGADRFPFQAVSISNCFSTRWMSCETGSAGPGMRPFNSCRLSARPAPPFPAAFPDD